MLEPALPRELRHVVVDPHRRARPGYGGAVEPIGFGAEQHAVRSFSPSHAPRTCPSSYARQRRPPHSASDRRVTEARDRRRNSDLELGARVSTRANRRDPCTTDGAAASREQPRLEIQVEVRERVLDRRRARRSADIATPSSRAHHSRGVSLRGELGQAVEPAPDCRARAGARAARGRPVLARRARSRGAARERASAAAPDTSPACRCDTRAQSVASGHTVHAGRERVHSVAPRSMIACV